MGEKLEDAGLGMASGAVGQVLGLVAGGIQDKRQLKQQGKLQNLQIKGNKEMADYNRNLAMKTWEETNYNAQKEQMEKAGLNVGLMYGGAGAGGGTVNAGGGGNVSGATAGDPNAGVGMGMQLASQTRLMEAQAKNLDANTAKTEAETSNTGATQKLTEGKTEEQGFTNAVNKAVGIDRERLGRIGEVALKEVAGDKAWDEYQAWQAGNLQGKQANDYNSPLAKAIRAGLEQTEQSLQNSKTQGNIMEATKAIEEFKAGLAKQGISPDSPWYVKILGDLLSKIGLNPLNGVKNIMN